MHKNFTPESLVKLNSKTSEPIREALNENEYEPSAMVISNILSYSKVLSVRKINHLGVIEMVLN